jgi:hypothetical protein
MHGVAIESFAGPLVGFSLANHVESDRHAICFALGMRHQIVDTHGYVHEESSRLSVLTSIGRVLDYLFGVLYLLLLVRFTLEFFGARTSAGFFQFIRELTDAFYTPFKGLFATTTIDSMHFVWPLVVAILGYMVLHAMIRGLLRLIARA